MWRPGCNELELVQYEQEFDNVDLAAENINFHQDKKICLGIQAK